MFDDRQAAQQICILAPACRSSGSDRSSASNSGPGWSWSTSLPSADVRPSAARSKRACRKSFDQSRPWSASAPMKAWRQRRSRLLMRLNNTFMC